MTRGDARPPSRRRALLSSPYHRRRLSAIFHGEGHSGADRREGESLWSPAAADQGGARERSAMECDKVFPKDAFDEFDDSQVLDPAVNVTSLNKRWKIGGVVLTTY
jgi:hypothetical protein